MYHIRQSMTEMPTPHQLTLKTAAEAAAAVKATYRDRGRARQQYRRQRRLGGPLMTVKSCCDDVDCSSFVVVARRRRCSLSAARLTRAVAMVD